MVSVDLIEPFDICVLGRFSQLDMFSFNLMTRWIKTHITRLLLNE